MARRVDRLGQVLVRNGTLTEETLKDVLDQQQQQLPLASLCYTLGYADEETLVRALSKHCGVPAIVLDASVIDLSVLEGVSQELATRHVLLPVYEDERRIFVASQSPHLVSEVFAELQLVRGKLLVPHLALQVTLARTIRHCFDAFSRGERVVRGLVAQAGPSAFMAVVSDVAAAAIDTKVWPAHEALLEDVTKELVESDLVLIEAEETEVPERPSFNFDESSVATAAPPSELDAGTTGSGDGDRAAGEASSTFADLQVEPVWGHGSSVDLDSGEGAQHQPRHAGPARVLIVDDDFATRHLLVKELQPMGIATATAATGGEAVRAIKRQPPDLVLIDVMLPEIDGFGVCRAIKQSRKYKHIPVILMSAVLDSGRVTDSVLRRYGADAYFEKPMDTARVRARVTELLQVLRSREVTSDDESFEQAIALYKEGHLDEAVEVLRLGLRVDPLSAKHHFVLANLLQKKSLLYEAIDEYEATVDLKPDYFPALTRLAYLYYKKGFSAKAIEMWQRSLPHCSDGNLRQNIEVFMRKLIAEMQTEV